MNNNNLISYGYTFERLCTDDRIGYQAIAIYDVLSTIAGNDCQCTTTVAELCERLQMTEKTFFKYQRDLLDAGYISSKHQGGHNGNLYTLELKKDVFNDMKRLYNKHYDDMELLNLDVPTYYELATGHKLTKSLIKLFGDNYYLRNNWVINYALLHAVDGVPYENPIQVILYANEIINRWVVDPEIETKDDIDNAEDEYHRNKQAERNG